MTPRARPHNLAATAGVVLSVAFVLLYVAVALARMRYPYELEWMEGGMVEHVRRLLEGRPLSAPPSLEFVSFLYPPGYYLAGAAFSWIFGAGFFPLRLLSFLSSIGAFALLASLVRKETGSWTRGAVAAGLFAATFARAGGWLDLARLDSFYLAVLLGGAYALRAARFRAGAPLAGLLLAAAFFTKQSALLVLVPVLAYATWLDRRRGLTATAVAFATIVAGVVLLEASSGRWFSYYCFTLPGRHPRLPSGAWSFWVRDLLPAVPFALVASFAAVRRVGFLPVLAGALVAGSWSVRCVYGAEVNNLLPAFAAIALLAGTLAGTKLVWDLLLVAQLLWLVYAPGPLVPSREDRAAGDRIVARLAGVEGGVFLPHHGYLARLAGKDSVAHTLAMDNVFLDDTGPARQALERQVRDALASQRFGAAVIESDGRYLSWIVEGYEPRERLIDAPDAFWPVSGGRLRPDALALPRRP